MIPADVLAERVAASLRRAKAFGDAGSHEECRKALTEAKEWLDKLREAL